MNKLKKNFKAFLGRPVDDEAAESGAATSAFPDGKAGNPKRQPPKYEYGPKPPSTFCCPICFELMSDQLPKTITYGLGAMIMG